MKTLLIVAVLLPLVAAQAAVNILTISAAQGGQVAAGANYINFDDLALGSSPQTATGPNGSVLVTFEGDAAVVQGDVFNLHSAAKPQPRWDPGRAPSVVSAHGGKTLLAGRDRRSRTVS